MTARAAIAVLGLGNELFSDEGVGVHAARAIAELDLADVEALDGGTLGLALLPELEGRRALLVLDAVVADGHEPGDIIEMGPEELIRPNALLMSAHQIGVPETLAAASLMGVAPARLGAVGMVPFSLETGYGLSAAAAGRLPEMVARGLSILQGWGVEVPAHA